MPTTRTLQQSLIGGELTATLFGRAGDQRVQNGVAKCSNFIIQPVGSARTRPGTRHVDSAHVGVAGDELNKVRLIPFKFGVNQELVLAFGRATDPVSSVSKGWIRFYSQGAPVLYTMPRAYVASQAITATNNAGDLLLTTAATTGLVVNDPVAFTNTGGSLPPGLTAGVVYYVVAVSVVTAGKDFKIATSIGGTPITFGGAGAPVTKFKFAYVPGDLVKMSLDSIAYCSSAPYLDPLNDNAPFGATSFWYREPGTNFETTTFDIANDLVNWTAHGLREGDPVTFSGASGASTPAGNLPFGTVFYVLNPTTNSFQVSATPFGTAIDILAGASGGIYTLANAIYECPHGFADADLMDVTYDQSADVISFAHQNYPPSELRRAGATRWTTTTVSLAPTLPAPSSITITSDFGEGLQVMTASGLVGAEVVFTVNTPGHDFVNNFTQVQLNDVVNVPSGRYIVYLPAGATSPNFKLKQVATGAPVVAVGGSASASTSPPSMVREVNISADDTHDYVVTTVAQDGTESTPSSVKQAVCNLGVSGAKNTLTWPAVPGAARYRVYRKLSGLFGYIGQVSANPSTGVADGAFVDDNIDPDLGIAPPSLDTTLTNPGAVGHYDQRRGWGGTPSDPQGCWLTKVGTESDLTFSLPVLDSDRIKFRVASRYRCTIRHIVPVDHLLLLTDSAEFRASPVNTDALTPGGISVRPQSYVGSSLVQPVIVNSNVIFAAARGGHLYEIAFRIDAQSFFPGNLSLRAGHLFRNRRIVDLAAAKAPDPVIWAVGSNGQLFGFTYVPEEQVGAWHQHSTDGTFESVAVIAEGDEDAVYVVVLRNGLRRIERFSSRVFTTLQNSFQVDAGVTFTGATSKVKGLRHLIGKTVSVFVDGKVQPQKVVDANGEITLTTPATTVAHAGLPFTAQIDTLPLAMQIEASGHGRQKNIDRVYVRTVDSAPFLSGSLGGTLWPSDPQGLSTGVSTGVVAVAATGAWTDDAQATIRVTDPVPVEIAAIVLETAVGGG